MPKVKTTTHTTDFALKLVEILSTAAGYSIRLKGHEITSVNGAPVSSEIKVYVDDVAGFDTSKLKAEVDKIVAAIKHRDYSGHA